LSERRVALLTGTNRGTGRAIAGSLRDAKWRIISLNRTVAGEKWLGEIPCDLADASEVEAGIAEVKQRADCLHACVLNAAIRRLAPVATLSMSDLVASVAVNLLTPFRLTQATLPLVRKVAGLYVFMGSHAATRYFEGGAAYSCTKAALKGLVETLLLEERAHGVRAVLVSPGAIANRVGDRSPHKMSASSVGEFVGRLITNTPPDIAVGEVEIRPALLAASGVTGIARLQSI
jgi:3-oxoacyl-[acyl-carrier protein] reductase